MLPLVQQIVPDNIVRGKEGASGSPQFTAFGGAALVKPTATGKRPSGQPGQKASKTVPNTDSKPRPVVSIREETVSMAMRGEAREQMDLPKTDESHLKFGRKRRDKGEEQTAHTSGGRGVHQMEERGGEAGQVERGAHYHKGQRVDRRREGEEREGRRQRGPGGRQHNRWEREEDEYDQGKKSDKTLLSEWFDQKLSLSSKSKGGKTDSNTTAGMEWEGGGTWEEEYLGEAWAYEASLALAKEEQQRQDIEGERWRERGWEGEERAANEVRRQEFRSERRGEGEQQRTRRDERGGRGQGRGRGRERVEDRERGQRGGGRERDRGLERQSQRDRGGREQLQQHLKQSGRSQHSEHVYMSGPKPREAGDWRKGGDRDLEEDYAGRKSGERRGHGEVRSFGHAPERERLTGYPQRREYEERMEGGGEGRRGGGRGRGGEAGVGEMTQMRVGRGQGRGRGGGSVGVGRGRGRGRGREDYNNGTARGGGRREGWEGGREAADDRATDRTMNRHSDNLPAATSHGNHGNSHSTDYSWDWVKKGAPLRAKKTHEHN